MPLRIVLMLLQTTAGQNSIYIWCRDHRMHHKYTETDADPHTTTRGMFFAHMGWLMMKKHPEVVRLGKVLDCSDLMADPVVRFQYRWFVPLVILGVGVVPFYVYRLMGFSPELASFLTLARYLILLHGTWCVNSIAHWIGSKPYDKTIRPTESIFTSWLTNGEGFHNFHHVFPFDYKAAELPFSPLNFSTVLINVMAAIGQVYNLKEASEEMIVKRKARTGDGHIY
ncbi:stearoyl-CoA desaturase 5-like [Tropilaelaps mercedesae]|uniref:Stearoyl-CoA desaturase 5-like n=1 Tax=Tropilaelaps mercedesae TaxID=418985 RepID=A0A1V9XPY1_9ACAR|nr:stearoyl-CoA desaturase 5-like [Tropilaelaps mercedesae]